LNCQKLALVIEYLKEKCGDIKQAILKCEVITNTHIILLLSIQRWKRLRKRWEYTL